MAENRKYEEREAPFTVKLEKWCRYNLIGNWAAEVKVVDMSSTKRTFNYNTWLKVYPQQYRNLKIATRHFLHKFSDASQMGTPLDLISVVGEGYFIIQFQHDKSDKQFFIIKIEDIQKEIENGSKSLSEERAREIAHTVGELK